jgi:hypothetical protein
LRHSAGEYLKQHEDELLKQGYISKDILHAYSSNLVIFCQRVEDNSEAVLKMTKNNPLELDILTILAGKEGTIKLLHHFTPPGRSVLHHLLIMQGDSYDLCMVFDYYPTNLSRFYSPDDKTSGLIILRLLKVYLFILYSHSSLGHSVLPF